MNILLEEIRLKAESSNLKTRIHKKKQDLGLLFTYDDDSEEEKEILIIQIPEERDDKSIFIDVREDKELELIKNSQFEKFKFLKSFEAIWSDELGVIECEIQTDDSVRSSGYILSRLRRLFKNQVNNDDPKYRFEFPSPDENMKIYIGRSSLEFTILSNLQKENLYRGLRSRPTIRIEYKNINTHEKTKQLLKKVANSVLFQIDLAINLPMHLSLDRELFREIKISRRAAKRGEIQLRKPKFEYDEEPMALYWYGRTATNMPLLQYLSFYQVLEFYFPYYSQIEAQRKIKNLLKDPLFDYDNDGDIAKVLNTIKMTGKGKAIGDEKSQIKATIEKCITKEDLREFLLENEERKDFFDIQKKSKSVVQHKISFSNKDQDIRPEVANRIYEIRCRIVHTKEESNKELLLPFSPEVKNLKHDLDLIEFIARKVLTAGGRSLKLP